MLDHGFIGHFPVGETVPLALQCRANNLSVKEPTGTPTYTVLRPDGYVIDTGEVGTTVDSLTGFRLASLGLDKTADWQPGILYTVVFSYVIDSENNAGLSTFQVV